MNMVVDKVIDSFRHGGGVPQSAYPDDFGMVWSALLRAGSKTFCFSNGFPLCLKYKQSLSAGRWLQT